MFDLAQNLTTGRQGPSYGTKSDRWGAAYNYSRSQKKKKQKEMDYDDGEFGIQNP